MSIGLVEPCRTGWRQKAPLSVTRKAGADRFVDFARDFRTISQLPVEG